MSTPDSVIIFVLALLVIFVIIFVAMFVRSGRNTTSQADQEKKSVQAGARVKTDNPAVAKRLDPSATGADTGDPRGADIGGNYSK